MFYDLQNAETLAINSHPVIALLNIHYGCHGRVVPSVNATTPMWVCLFDVMHWADTVLIMQSRMFSGDNIQTNCS